MSKIKLIVLIAASILAVSAIAAAVVGLLIEDYTMFFLSCGLSLLSLSLGGLASK